MLNQQRQRRSEMPKGRKMMMPPEFQVWMWMLQEEHPASEHQHPRGAVQRNGKSTFPLIVLSYDGFEKNTKMTEGV
jgi:hypothetical protein